MKKDLSARFMYAIADFCLVFLTLGMDAASAAEIFKSFDSQGRPVYSDRPPPGPAERIYLPATSRRDEEMRRTAAELAELKRREGEREVAQTREAEEKLPGKRRFVRSSSVANSCAIAI